MITLGISTYTASATYTSMQSAVQQLLNAVADEINGKISSQDVTIGFGVIVDESMNGITDYAGGSGVETGVNLGTALSLYTNVIANKVRTGTDLNGASNDGTFWLSTRMMSHVATWMQDSGSTDGQSAYSAALHEIVHAMGFQGYLSKTTGGIGPFGNIQTAFDQHVSVIDNVPYFIGPTAASVFGANIPLTSFGTPASIYHLNLEPQVDVMNSGSYTSGSLSNLDLAILYDLDYLPFDTLTSADGRTIYAGARANTITGTTSNDTAVYTGSKNGYTISTNGTAVTVTNNANSADVDTLAGVERLQFADQSYDIPSVAPVLPLDHALSTQAFRAYLAYFGRPPDPGGLASWATHLQNPSHTIDNMISVFGNSTESNRLYGDSSAGAKVEAIFQHLFGRSPLAEGRTFWTNAIETGILSMSAAALNIMDGARNANGFNDLTIVNEKLDASRAFVAALDTAWESNLYAGATAGLNARKYLSTITADNGHNDQVIALVGQVVDALPGSVDTLFASNGISLGYY